MYINKDLEKQRERAALKEKLEELEYFKVLAPDLIKKYEKNIETDPANMTRWQFNLNYVMQKYLNIDAAIYQIRCQLVMLL